jgi:LysR family glycine cleavage system transcriptional activator
MHHVDFAREDVDLAVRHGDGNWLGLHVERLCVERLFAVCSPTLLASRGSLSGPGDVLKFPLLHLDDRKDWSKWLEAAGVLDAELLHGPVLNRASMLIDAAVDGQGMALARTALAAWDMVHGRLVAPFAVTLPLSKGYWIVCPKATAVLPKIAVFREWLLNEAAADVRRLSTIRSNRSNASFDQERVG